MDDHTHPPPSPASPFRAARARLGLSQTEVANRAGVSQRAVSDLDNGHIARSVEVARAVARAVGLTLDEAFPDARFEIAEGPEVDRSSEYAQPDAEGA